MKRTIIYSYSDRTKPDLEIESTPTISFKEGDLIVRRERTWKIETIHLERVKDATTIWVLLVDPPVN